MENPYYKQTLLTHFVATLLMTGTLWFIQIVHYRLFSFVGDTWISYEEAHKFYTTIWVMPVMAIELLTALALCIEKKGLFYINAALVGVIWLITALWAVPAHMELSQGFSNEVHQDLMMANLSRTLVWTIRAVALTGVFWSLLRSCPRD